MGRDLECEMQEISDSIGNFMVLRCCRVWRRAIDSPVFFFFFKKNSGPVPERPVVDSPYVEQAVS